MGKWNIHQTKINTSTTPPRIQSWHILHLVNHFMLHFHSLGHSEAPNNPTHMHPPPHTQSWHVPSSCQPFCAALSYSWMPWLRRDRGWPSVWPWLVADVTRPSSDVCNHTISNFVTMYLSIKFNTLNDEPAFFGFTIFLGGFYLNLIGGEEFYFYI